MSNRTHEIIQQLENNSIVCREDFALVDGSCVARCDSWSEYSDIEKLMTGGLALFAAICGLLGGALLITVSIIHRKTMWVTVALFSGIYVGSKLWEGTYSGICVHQELHFLLVAKGTF